jgi:hypothetical protein
MEDTSSTAPTAFDEVPEPPAFYITIRHTYDGQIEVDVGDLPYEAALGLLTMALAELNDCRPEVLLRSSSPIYCHECSACVEAEEDEDEE